MNLIVDAGPLVALADPEEPLRDQILAVLDAEQGRVVTPAPTTAEVDYLLGRRFGAGARRAFVSDLSSGRLEVACLERADYEAVIDLELRYADLDLGLADCALVVLADRYETTRILSFDGRHLRAVTALDGTPFTLLPADS